MARTRRRSQEEDKSLIRPDGLMDPWSGKPQTMPRLNSDLVDPFAQDSAAPAPAPTPAQPPVNPFEDTATYHQAMGDVMREVEPTAERVAGLAHETRYENDNEREDAVNDAATAGDSAAFAELARRAAAYSQSEPQDSGPDWNAELTRAQQENKAHDRYTAWSASRAARGGRLLSQDYVHRTDPEDSLARRMTVYNAVQARRDAQRTANTSQMSEQRLNDPNSPDSMFARQSLRSMASTVGAMNGRQYLQMAQDMKAMSEDPNFTASRYQYLVDNNLLPIQTILRSSTTANGQVLNLFGRREGQDESAGEAALGAATSVNNNLRNAQSAERIAAMRMEAKKRRIGAGGVARDPSQQARIMAEDELLGQAGGNVEQMDAVAQQAGMDNAQAWIANRVSQYMAGDRNGLAKQYSDFLQNGRRQALGGFGNAIRSRSSIQRAVQSSNVADWDATNVLGGRDKTNFQRMLTSRSRIDATTQEIIAMAQDNALLERAAQAASQQTGVPISSAQFLAQKLRILKNYYIGSKSEIFGVIHKHDEDIINQIIPNINSPQYVMDNLPALLAVMANDVDEQLSAAAESRGLVRRAPDQGARPAGGLLPTRPRASAAQPTAPAQPSPQLSSRMVTITVTGPSGTGAPRQVTEEEAQAAERRANRPNSGYTVTRVR